MDNSELKNAIEKLVGRRLTSIGLACEMMIFHFESYALHTQCQTRIIKGSDILVTTLDYQSWDCENPENNDEWYNLDKYRPVIVGGRVLSAEVNPLNDLIIILDNGIRIEVCIENGNSHYGDEREQYRFFEIADGNSEQEQAEQKHFVVFNKRIITV